MEKLTKALGTVVLFLSLLTSIAVIRGLTLAVLWGWFVAPLGVVDIGVPEAIGISMVVGFLTLHYRDQDLMGEKQESIWIALGVACFQAVFLALWVLSIGWVVHQFAW